MAQIHSSSDKWKKKCTARIIIGTNFLFVFVSHPCVFISAVVSLLSALHKYTTLIPLVMTFRSDRASVTRRAGEGGWSHALRFDLLLSGSSFLFLLLCRINIRIDFDLFGYRDVLISSIWHSDENRDVVDEQSKRSNRGRDTETQRGWERVTHQVPVDVSEEWMTHDVCEACLRVAA